MAETADIAPLAPGGPGRFRRVLGAVFTSVGLAGVFVVALAGSVVVHLNAPTTRRTVRAVANVVFTDFFKGRVVVGDIDHLGLDGVRLRAAEAYDPAGTLIVRAGAVRADADVIGIVRSALFGTGELEVMIRRIHLDQAEVALQRGEDGVPTIAQAFLPRGVAAPAEPGARKVHVVLDRIEIDHVAAHGDIAPPSFDADVSGAVGHFEVGPEGLSIDLEPTHVALRSPLPKPLAGAATFQLRGAPGKDVHLEGGFDGQVGPLDVHATGEMQGARVAGRVEIPHALGGEIASLLPGAPPPIPLRVPVATVIEAEGELPEIDFKTTLSFEGGGSIDAEGTLAVRVPLTVDVAVGVHGVDPRVVLDVPQATPITMGGAQGPPQTPLLDATGHVLVEVDTDTRIDAEATTRPFVLAGNVIPRVVASASFAHGVWHGSATVDEIGAPLAASFSFDPQVGLGFDVTGKVPSLRGVPRLELPVDGGGTVAVVGTLNDGALDAHVKARVEGIKAPGAVTLASGGLDGRVHGPLAALEVDATVTGSGLQAGDYAWDRVLAHVRGPVLAPQVDAALDGGSTGSLSASGKIDVKDKAVTGVDVELRRRDGTIRARVARISAAQGGTRIEGLDLEGGGVGTLKGGLLVVGKEITGKLHGENVDLARVALVAGLPLHVAGLANVDVDLTSSRQGLRTGHIALELVNGEALLLNGVSGLITATFDGDHLRADGLVRVIASPTPAEKALGVAAAVDVAAAFGTVVEEPCDGAVARLRFTKGSAELPGPLLDPATWRKLAGSVELAADEWNLRCIRRMVPFGLPDLRGRLTTRATVERAPGARLPSVRGFFAKTLGLEVVDTDWESRHTDVEIRAAVDGDTGVTGAKVSLFDGDLLASASLAATVDLPLLLDQPERRWASLRRAPVSGRVFIPRNRVTAFAGLPTFVTDRVPLISGKNGDTLSGEVQLEAVLKGTLDAPSADVTVGAWDLALATLQQTAPGKGAPRSLQPVLGDWGVPVDIDAHATYDGREATLETLHIVRHKHEVAGASGQIALLLADLLAGNVHPTGSFKAQLEELPLGDVPFLADLGIGGHLSGTLAMTGIGAKPSLHVDLEMPDAKVGHDVAYDHTSLKLDIEPPAPTASGERSASTLQVALGGPESGTLTTTVTHGVSWLGGLVPVLDLDMPGKLALTAKAFRVAAAAPFVSAAVGRIDGVLDGDAHIDWGAHGAGGAARFNGVHLGLAHGILNLPQLGQELHDISLEVAGGGDGAVALTDIQARGTKGLITGSGSAHFNGLTPRDATLKFNIKKGEELPLTLEGVALGDVSGPVTVTAVAHDHDWAVKVGLSRLLVDLAPSLGRSVISTSDNPDITLDDPRRLAVAPAAAPPSAGRISLVFDPVHVDIEGNIQGNTIDSSLVAPGPITVVLGGKKPRVSGTITIARGRIEVLHKLFEIEEGSIHLHPEDIDKIDVHVTARWDSPDGQIFIEYDGLLSPISPEKIKFHSPTIPQDRIISTLLGGADQATPAGGAQSTASAVPGQSLATQLIAQQFSTQIAQNISTSIGTGDDGSIRPGLTYRAGNLSVDVSTYSTPRAQHSLGTVDWRFWRNWVLRGRVDVGSDQQTSGVDLLWQYRY